MEWLDDQSVYREDFKIVTPLPDPTPAKKNRNDDKPYEEEPLFPELSKYKYEAGEI